MAGKNFLTVPALAGVLEKGSQGVNLINALGLAKDQGLIAERVHKAGTPSVSISDGSTSVTGNRITFSCWLPNVAWRHVAAWMLKGSRILNLGVA